MVTQTALQQGSITLTAIVTPLFLLVALPFATNYQMSAASPSITAHRVEEQNKK